MRRGRVFREFKEFKEACAVHKVVALSLSLNSLILLCPNYTKLLDLSQILRFGTTSVLVHIVVLSVALVVLQVGQRCRLNTDVEGPTLMVTEWNPREGHLPAVEVTGEGE